MPRARKISARVSSGSSTSRPEKNSSKRGITNTISTAIMITITTISTNG
jgi:hypothetical protein